MKKRLLALILTLMLALMMSVPALMEDASQGSIDPPPTTPIALPTNAASMSSVYLDVPTDASATSYYTAYAIITKTDWVKPDYKISWKDINAKDILMNGKYDYTKLLSVKYDSYLVIPQNGDIITKGTTLNAQKMASLSSLIKTDNAKIYELTPPSAKPKLPKPAYEEGVASYTFTGNLEYQILGSSTWTSVTSPLIIKLEEYKVEYSFRTAATETKSASLPVKLTIPALANAPSTKLDMVKGEIKFKSGWEIVVYESNNSTKTSILPAAKTLSIGSETSFENNTISSTAKKVEYRVPTNGKKASSTWATLYLDVNDGESLGNDANEYFTLGAKNTVTVIGAVPIQIQNSTKLTWKTVKAIKLADFANGTVKVRMAGSKTKLPGAPKTLKIDTVGNLTFDAA